MSKTINKLLESSSGLLSKYLREDVQDDTDFKDLQTLRKSIKDLEKEISQLKSDVAPISPLNYWSTVAHMNAADQARAKELQDAINQKGAQAYALEAKYFQSEPRRVADDDWEEHVIYSNAELRKELEPQVIALRKEVGALKAELKTLLEKTANAYNKDTELRRTQAGIPSKNQTLLGLKRDSRAQNSKLLQRFGLLDAANATTEVLPSNARIVDVVFEGFNEKGQPYASFSVVIENADTELLEFSSSDFGDYITEFGHFDTDAFCNWFNDSSADDIEGTFDLDEGSFEIKIIDIQADSDIFIADPEDYDIDDVQGSVTLNIDLVVTKIS